MVIQSSRYVCTVGRWDKTCEIDLGRQYVRLLVGQRMLLVDPDTSLYLRAMSRFDAPKILTSFAGNASFRCT